MSKARANAILTPGRNAFINGGFDVWQRGTSFTGQEFTADRWRTSNNGGSRTVSRQDFTPGQTDVPGTPKYFLRYDFAGGTASGNYEILQQKIESVFNFAGETLTISFYAKAAAATDITIAFEQVFGTGGSTSAKVNGILPQTFSLTTSWQRHTATVTLPSISGKTLGTNGDDYLAINAWLSAHSNFDARSNSLGPQTGTVDFANVQIEKGSVATPFERRPLATEWDLCNRYYYTTYNEGQVGVVSNANGSTQRHAGATDIRHTERFPVRMRASPTRTVYSPDNGTSGKAYNASTVNDIAADFLGAGTMGVTVRVQSLTEGHAIRWHITADAEL